MTERSPGPGTHLYLRVDPIACDGYGYCAELLGELVHLDDWGYPVLEEGPIGDELLAEARQVVKACPKLALRVTGK
jgi:ferredoxin